MLSRVLSHDDADVQPVTWRGSRSDAHSASTPRLVRSVPPAPQRRSAPAVPNAEFEAQIHQQLQAAFESGVREGEAAARQKLEAEVGRAVEQLSVAAAEVAASRAEAMRRAEADIVQLSIEIARRILHREVSVDPAALGALVRAALDKLASQQVYRVRVHPDQEQLVRTTLAQLGRGSNIEVVSEASEPRGGAIFETSSGALDASVDTQLREIERGFADQLQERA